MYDRNCQKSKVLFYSLIILQYFMDYDRRHARCVSIVFRVFVSVTLTILLGMHIYAYFWGPTPESLDGDYTDIKFLVAQLSNGLTDVKRKHANLQTELNRMSGVLPHIPQANSKVKDALEPCRRNICPRLIGDIINYDRQVADYALESAGAKVVDTADTIDHVIYESPVGWALHSFASWMCRECMSARAMLQPGTLPGECWAFKGSKGEATIRLLGTVKINGFSFEHIPAHIAPTREISSAPRICQVEGLESRNDPYPHDFGSFEYDKNGKPIQYFEVRYPAARGYNLVRLRVLSNWGNPEHTCVYRFRVHGDLLREQVHLTDGNEGFIENEQ